MENRFTKFFRKQFFKIKNLFLMDPNEKFYRELGKKVDNILEFEIDDKELANYFCVLYQKNLFANGIATNDSRITQYDVKGMYPLKTKISKDQAIELVGDFFATIFPDRKEHFLKILNGNGQNSDTQKITLNFDTTGKIDASATSPMYPTDDITVNIPLYGDLRDVYTLVHEISHTIDAVNGANETRAIWCEVIPQAMERALDDFLDCMSKEERDKYGFDLETLEQDIKDRRLATFINRLNIIKGIPSKNGANKMYSTGYMLAQIYQSKFIKLFSSPKQFGEKITEFANAVINNDREKANSVVGIDLNPANKATREKFVDETIKQFTNEIIGRTALRTNEEVVLDLKLKYKEILSQKPDDVIKEAFDIWKRRSELVHKNINPPIEVMSPEVKEIFDLLEEFRKEIKANFLDNGLTLSHITSVSPTEMEGRKIRKSIQIPNHYETKIVDGVFASSERVNGTNPYIARTDKGMIFLGGKAYVFGSDNFKVEKDNNGNNHVYLEKSNYAYFLNPEGFEPEVGLSVDKDGKPFFDFSNEWISPNDIDLENTSQVAGYKRIDEVTDLLKNYKVLVDVNGTNIGMQIREKIFDKNQSVSDIQKFILEKMKSGDVRYINAEANISFKDFRLDLLK